MYPALYRNEEIRNAPTVQVQSENATTQWLELKRRYVELRGSTASQSGKAIPKTTNSDVLQLATRWSRELEKLSIDKDRDKSERDRWRACLKQVDALADPKAPGAEYPKNEVFWECSRRLAIYLESRKVRPSGWDLAVESVKETLAEVPETLGNATRSAAGAAASVVKDPAKLAAVLLGAAILLPPLIRAVRK